MTRLGLGTAQFGLDYGATNRDGQVRRSDVAEILSEATRLGVDLLDTAAAYGNAEEVLGGASDDLEDFSIVTKVRALGTDRVGQEELDRALSDVDSSLAHLGVDNLYGVLLHDADDALREGSEALVDRLREHPAIERVGFSVYSGEQIDALLDRWDFDLVQVPINVFDRRLVSGGQLKRLRAAGVEIHARSAYLQGLVVAEPPDDFPQHLQPLVDHSRRFRRALEDHQLTPVEGALGFLRQLDTIDAIVIGVTNVAQLSEAHQALSRSAIDFDFSPFGLNDERLVNPALWHRSTP